MNNKLKLLLIVVVAIGIVIYWRRKRDKIKVYKIKEKFIPEEMKVINEYNIIGFQKPINTELDINYEFDYEDNVNEINEINEIMWDEILRDKQNVHDSIVQRVIKDKYKKLEKREGNGDIIQEIIDYVDDGKKEKIKNILNKIKIRNSTLMNFEYNTEMDILEKTWRDSNDKVKDQIINEIIDCKNEKTNDVHCPTGVATRIINATYIETPEKMPKTKEIIHQEMMNTAAKIREKLENDDIFREMTDEVQKVAMKNEILKKYNIDYDGILNTSEIEDMTKDWIEYV